VELAALSDAAGAALLPLPPVAQAIANAPKHASAVIVMRRLILCVAVIWQSLE
jgi:hypothetical protein